MRKTNLAIAVLVASAFSGVAGAATVYSANGTTVDVGGYFKGAHTFDKAEQKNGTDHSEAQISVKAQQKLNDTFSLLGYYEGEYDVNDTHARHWHNRKVYGGIDAGKYGTTTVGRQQGVVYNVMGMTDVNPETVSGWGSAGDSTGLTGRTDSVIQYQNKFDNVTVTGQYKLATTQSVETGRKVDQGAGYGFSATADNIFDTGLFGGVAYANQKISGSADANVYGVGGGWTNGVIYTAATSTVGKNTNSVKSFYDNEVIGQYNFQNGVTPSLGYVDTNAGGLHHKFVETGLAYNFNKNVVADVGFGYDVSTNKDNVVKTGIKYKF